jgi:hypothetical protein
MRQTTRLTLGTTLSMLALGFFVGACSSDDSGSSSPPKETPRDASVTVPPETPARKPITVIIKGHGRVTSIDGDFTCDENGAPDGGACHPPHFGGTLYADTDRPWAFHHWEPSGDVDTSVELESWTPDPLTAVFTQLPDGGH